MDLSNLFITEIIQVTVSMFFAYAMHHIVAYIKTKNNDIKINSAIKIMDKILISAVKGIEQTLKEDLKKESIHGKLTPGQQYKLKNNAINTVEMNLTNASRKDILKAIPDLHSYLSNKIEDVIYDIKLSKYSEEIEPEIKTEQINGYRNDISKDILNTFAIGK